MRPGVLSAEADGKTIDTIEGMAEGEALHPLQRKFIDHIALQCGICTPGLLIAARDSSIRSGVRHPISRF